MWGAENEMLGHVKAQVSSKVDQETGMSALEWPPQAPEQTAGENLDIS